MSKKKKVQGFNISSLNMDKKKQTQGVWFDCVGGLRLRLGYLGNPQFQEEYRKRIKPYRRLMKDGNLPDEIAQKVFCEPIDRFVLFEWENLTDYVDGEEQVIPYSHEAALKYLKKYPEFLNLVVDLASEADAFRAEYKEVVEGNSGAA